MKWSQKEAELDPLSFSGLGIAKKMLNKQRLSAKYAAKPLPQKVAVP